MVVVFAGAIRSQITEYFAATDLQMQFVERQSLIRARTVSF